MKPRKNNNMANQLKKSKVSKKTSRNTCSWVCFELLLFLFCSGLQWIERSGSYNEEKAVKIFNFIVLSLI